jgi:hypothetical protein
MKAHQGEPSVFWSGRKGEPWDGFWFWNCGRPKADMARHIEQYHPARRRSRLWPWSRRLREAL